MGLKTYPLSVMLDMGKLVLCFWVIQILSNMYYIQISASGSFPANPSLNPDVSGLSLPGGPLCLCWARHGRTQTRRTAGAVSRMFTDLAPPRFLSITTPDLKVSEFPTFTHGRIMSLSPTHPQNHPNTDEMLAFPPILEMRARIIYWTRGK